MDTDTLRPFPAAALAPRSLLFSFLCCAVRLQQPGVTYSSVSFLSSSTVYFFLPTPFYILSLFLRRVDYCQNKASNERWALHSPSPLPHHNGRRRFHFNQSFQVYTAAASRVPLLQLVSSTRGRFQDAAAAETAISSLVRMRSIQRDSRS